MYSTHAKGPMAVIDDESYKQYINSFCISTKGTWIISVTCGTVPSNPADHLVYTRRSEDRGLSWEPRVYSYIAQEVEGSGICPEMGQLIPVSIPQSDGTRIDRVYQFHIIRDTSGGARFGRIVFTYSDNDGRTWLGAGGENTVYEVDTPLYELVPHHWGWHLMAPPLTMSNGEIILPVNVSTDPKLLDDICSEVVFMVSSSLDKETDPANVCFDFYPRPPHGVQAERLDRPQQSLAQEAQVVELSDGRLMTVMRTGNGNIHYAVSGDYGRSWSPSQPLRYAKGGDILLHPNCPCPFIGLSGGRYSLLFCNNDGSYNGGTSPFDHTKNRQPIYITIGRETGNVDGQPLTFGRPELLCSIDGFRPDASWRDLTYGHFMEDQGEYYHFYNALWQAVQVNRVDPELTRGTSWNSFISG
jgi:hypothetical protein